jgi:HAD superfamily hydrolase (TIGR01509 family)
MSQFKNIIFDLGGVLINLDFNKTTEAFRDLGFPHFENMYSEFRVDQLFEKLETGKISPNEFYTVLLKIGNVRMVAEEIKNAWNSLLLDFREESLAFLKVLKKDYNIFLLSNTNIIHYDAFNTILKKQVGLDSLDHYFTKTYYSHQIGLRKPNQDIFDFVLKDAGITASETFFIDDTEANVETAKKMGFKTYLLLPGENIESLKYT